MQECAKVSVPSAHILFYMHSTIFTFQTAIASDCGRMQWQVLDWNTKAIGFYESIGGAVVKEWLTVHMRHPELGRFAAGEMSVNNNTPSNYTN